MFVQEAIKYAETTNQTINKIVQNNIDEKRVFLDYEFTLENLNKLTELNAKFDPNAHRFYIDPSFDKSLFNEFLPESERVAIEEQKQEETIEPQTQEVEQSQEQVLETSNEQVNSIEPKEEANEIEAEQNISIETNDQDIEQEQEQSIEATQEATIEQSDEIKPAINNEQEIEQTNTPSRAVQSEDLDRKEIQENSNEVSKQVDTTAEQIAKVDNSDIEADISTSFKPYKDYEVYGIRADFEDAEVPKNIEQELFNCENNERTKFFNYFSRAYRMGFFHDVSVKDVKDVITKLNVDYEREHEFIEWQTRFDPNYINNAKDFTDEEKNYTNNQVLQTHTALIDTIVKNPKLKEETLKNGMPPMSFIQIDNSRDRSNCYNQRSNDPFENPNALCDKKKYGIDKFTNRFIPLADANDYLNLLDEKYKKEYKHINFKKYDIYQNKKYNGNPINNDFSVIYKEENVGFNKFIIDERTAQNRLEYEIYEIPDEHNNFDFPRTFSTMSKSLFPKYTTQTFFIENVEDFKELENSQKSNFRIANISTDVNDYKVDNKYYFDKSNSEHFESHLEYIARKPNKDNNDEIKPIEKGECDIFINDPNLFKQIIKRTPNSRSKFYNNFYHLLHNTFNENKAFDKYRPSTEYYPNDRGDYESGDLDHYEDAYGNTTKSAQNISLEFGDKITSLKGLFQDAPIETIPNIKAPYVTDISYICSRCKALKDISSFDFSNIKDASCAFSHCISLKYIPNNIFSSLDNLEDGSHMFNITVNLNTNIKSLNLPNLKFADFMFQDSKINIKEVNIPNCERLYCTFTGCDNLTDITVNTNTHDLRSAFDNCHNLKNVTIKAPNITMCKSLFENCRNLKNVNLEFGTELKYIDYMFKNCYSLKEIPFFDVSKVENANQFIKDCYNLEKIPKFNFNKENLFENLTINHSYFFNNHHTNKFSSTSLTKDTCSEEFLKCLNIFELDQLEQNSKQIKKEPYIYTIDKPKLTEDEKFEFFKDLNGGLIKEIQINCNLSYSLFDSEDFLSLTKIDVPITVTENCTRLSHLFHGMRSLKEMPNIKNTSHVEDFSCMFAGCNSLEQINPKTEKLNYNDFKSLLDANPNKETINKLNLIDLSSATSVSSMFHSNRTIKQTPLFMNRPFNNKITDFSACFLNCSRLENTGNLNLENAKDISSMYYHCFELEKVYPLHTPKVTKAEDIFRDNYFRLDHDIPLFDLSHCRKQKVKENIGSYLKNSSYLPDEANNPWYKYQERLQTKDPTLVKLPYETMSKEDIHNLDKEIFHEYVHSQCVYQPELLLDDQCYKLVTENIQFSKAELQNIDFYRAEHKQKLEQTHTEAIKANDISNSNENKVVQNSYNFVAPKIDIGNNSNNNPYLEQVKDKITTNLSNLSQTNEKVNEKTNTLDNTNKKGLTR